MTACSPMLGQFIREDKPLTIQDLMDAYKLSRPRVNAEVSEMFNAGHIEPSGPETIPTTWTITAKGREAWHADDED